MKQITENQHTALSNIITGYLRKIEVIEPDSMVVCIIFQPKTKQEHSEQITENSVELVELLKQSLEPLWTKYRGSIPDHIHTRISHVFYNCNITTLYDLVTRSQMTLLNSRNMGHQSIKYIREWLAPMNLDLGMVFSEEINKAFRKEMLGSNNLSSIFDSPPHAMHTMGDESW